MRNWDIELTNDQDAIEQSFATEPQLCMVLAKHIKHDTLHRIIQTKHPYVTRIDDEDRVIVVAGAFKEDEPTEPDPIKTEKAFGRQITEQVHDDLEHIDGIPYFPFCRDLDPKVIDRIAEVLQVEKVIIRAEMRLAVRGCYYDMNNPPEIEGGIISQGEVKIKRSA